MKRFSNLGNNNIVETYGLSEELHNMVVDMVKNDKNKNGNYTLDELGEDDREMVNVWIADAFSEGDEEYAHFLQSALGDSAELYTLTDHVGDFSQPIGDVAVYDYDC